MCAGRKGCDWYCQDRLRKDSCLPLAHVGAHYGPGGATVGGGGAVWTRWYHSGWGWGSVDQVVPQWVGMGECGPGGATVGGGKGEHGISVD